MKTVLITGASFGIGRETALIFAKNGYNVAICCRRGKEALDNLKKEIEALGVNCLSYIVNVGNHSEVSDMMSDILTNWGQLDVLVNNAGISYVGLLQDMTIDEWNEVINVNLTSLYNTCHSALPSMVKVKKGAIINVSSMWGVVGASCEVAYSASKGGVNSFTKALAKELAPSGISVNAVAFGVIDTRMNACFDENEKASLAEEIPAGRFASATEAAQYIYNLSNENPYLTGQIITFDGGMI